MNLERTADVTFFRIIYTRATTLAPAAVKVVPKIHVGNDYSSYLSAKAMRDKSCLTSRTSLVYDHSLMLLVLRYNCFYLVGFKQHFS